MYFLIPREISKTEKQMIILPEELELANQHRHCQLGKPLESRQSWEWGWQCGQVQEPGCAPCGRGPGSLPESCWQGGLCLRARESFLPTNCSTVGT